MASLWKQLTTPRQSVNKGPSPEDLKTALISLGIEVMVTPEGGIVPIPSGASSDEVNDFAHRWQSVSNTELNAANRASRLSTYARMDDSGSESSIVLDTYADEIVNILDYSSKSLEINIDDKELAQKVFSVLSRNKVLDNCRSDIRDLCQNGDFAYALTTNSLKRLVDLDLTQERDGNVSTVRYEPNDLLVSYQSAPEYTLEHDSIDAHKLIPTKDSDLSGLKEALPWEFSLFRLDNRKTFPYGLSILEKMREPWDKLHLLEEMLAITRANRLDRIAFTVPGIKGDPTSVFNRLNALKNSIKNTILGNSTSRVSRNQDVGLTEYLWMPEGYKVERLSTSIEVSSIEDVEYFRDKLINSSRLPKGFFLASESGSTPRPMSLRQQDIKFARSTVPIGEAYCRGLRKLIYLIIFYLGGRIDKTRVTVNFKRSPYLSEELMQLYGDIYDIVDKFKDIRGSMSGANEVTDVDIKQILDLCGAPHKLVFPTELADTPKESLNEGLIRPVVTIADLLSL